MVRGLVGISVNSMLSISELPSSEFVEKVGFLKMVDGLVIMHYNTNKRARITEYEPSKNTITISSVPLPDMLVCLN